MSISKNVATLGLTFVLAACSTTGGPGAAQKKGCETSECEMIKTMLKNPDPKIRAVGVRSAASASPVIRQALSNEIGAREFNEIMKREADLANANRDAAFQAGQDAGGLCVRQISGVQILYAGKDCTRTYDVANPPVPAASASAPAPAGR